MLCLLVFRSLILGCPPLSLGELKDISVLCLPDRIWGVLFLPTEGRARNGCVLTHRPRGVLRTLLKSPVAASPPRPPGPCHLAVGAVIPQSK